MVLKIKFSRIIPVIIIALAFSDTLKSRTTWIYPFCVLSFFLAMCFIFVLKRKQINVKSKNFDIALKCFNYSFFAYLIIFIYSMILMYSKEYASNYIFRSAGACFCSMFTTIVISCMLYIYKEKTADIICYGLILEYFVEVIFAISKIGVLGFFTHLLDPLNTYQSLFENHAIGFALYLFIIYYVLDDFHKNRNKLIFLFVIEYLIMKRIALLGFCITMVMYMFVHFFCRISRIKIYKLIFLMLFIFSWLYILFVETPYYKSIMIEAGIYNRYLLVETMRNFYFIDTGYVGHGFGFVSVVLPNMSIVGKYGLTALHNGILKDYIELGFWGYTIAYFYFWVYMPIKLFGNTTNKTNEIVLCLLMFMLITLLTDNTFDYIAFMGALYAILACLKFKEIEEI